MRSLPALDPQPRAPKPEGHRPRLQRIAAGVTDPDDSHALGAKFLDSNMPGKGGSRSWPRFGRRSFAIGGRSRRAPVARSTGPPALPRGRQQHHNARYSGPVLTILTSCRRGPHRLRRNPLPRSLTAFPKAFTLNMLNAFAARPLFSSRSSIRGQEALGWSLRIGD